MSGRARLAVRVLLGAAVLFALGWFAYAHAGQTVDLNFGLFRLRNVPLPFALYGAIILGMLVVLVVGMKADLRMRELLRRHGIEPGRGPGGAGTGDPGVSGAAREARPERTEGSESGLQRTERSG